MATTNSGPFTSVSGTYYGGNGLVDASFFVSGASSDAYVSYSFGFAAGCIVLTNEGANDLAYLWPALVGVKSAGVQVDSGVVKAGATIVLPYLSNKQGISIRSRNAGSSTSFLISAI